MGYTRRTSRKAGLPPESFVHTGHILVNKPVLTIMDYTELDCKEYTPTSIDSSLLDIPNGVTRWIKVNGLQDINMVNDLCSVFGIHPLVQEDILNTNQRPKIDDYDQYLFVTAIMYKCDVDNNTVANEQIAAILGNNYVMLFVEGENGPFAGIRDRIVNNVGRIRKKGAGYLLYSILDVVVDNMYIVLDRFSDIIDDLEDRLMNDDGATLEDIQKLKRQMLVIHKATWPLRDVVSTVTRFDSDLVDQSLNMYFRDIYDHLAQIMDTTETLRDIVTGLLDVYLSNVSNRMNEIMKVLTIISTIAIPLTVISGIYGMNFKNMPELDSSFGYPAVLIFMIAVVVGMLIYFKKKKWW